jgi:hypothetical protein
MPFRGLVRALEFIRHGTMWLAFNSSISEMPLTAHLQS